MKHRIIKRSGHDTLVCGGDLIRSEKANRNNAFRLPMYEYTCKDCGRIMNSTNKSQPFCTYEVKEQKK